MKNYIILILIISFSLCSCTNIVKKVTKELAAETVENTSKIALKKGFSKASKKTLKSYSSKVMKSMDDKTFAVFKNNRYTERGFKVGEKQKPILISPKFDPNFKTPKQWNGNWDPVKFHNGDSRYVIDGCETNLGRMKRGLAPVYKDPKKLNGQKGMDDYHYFELHHAGQKKDPDYFAIMDAEHKINSKILHPKRSNSEIARNEFQTKERMPLYKEIAELIGNNPNLLSH